MKTRIENSDGSHTTITQTPQIGCCWAPLVVMVLFYPASFPPDQAVLAYAIIAVVAFVYFQQSRSTK